MSVGTDASPTEDKNELSGSSADVTDVNDPTDGRDDDDMDADNVTSNDDVELDQT